MEANSRVSAAVTIEVKEAGRGPSSRRRPAGAAHVGLRVGLKSVRDSSWAPSAATPLSVREVLIANRLGISQRIAATIRKMPVTREKSLSAGLHARGRGGAGDSGATTGAGLDVAIEAGLLTLGADSTDDLLEDRDHQDDQEQQHRGGGRLHDPVVRERRVGDQSEGDLRGDPGLAGGHQVHLIEDLQAGDDLQQDHQTGGTAQQRDGHTADLLPGRGAVDRGRLVELTGDLLQTREVQHEVEPDGPPDGRDRDPDHRGARVGQDAGALGRCPAASPAGTTARWPV